MKHPTPRSPISGVPCSMAPSAPSAPLVCASRRRAAMHSTGDLWFCILAFLLGAIVPVVWSCYEYGDLQYDTRECTLRCPEGAPSIRYRDLNKPLIAQETYCYCRLDGALP